MSSAASREVILAMPLVATMNDRPLLEPALRRLCEALRDANETALGHIEPAQLLFISSSARRAARASVRPLTLGGRPPRFRRDGWEKPQVWLSGRLALYEISLRPRYFLASTAGERARIICHELWHISPHFDGTLAGDRRHGSVDEDDIDAVCEDWCAAWRAAGAHGAEWLSFRGEMRLPAWTERPPSRLGPTGRRRYSEADLHLAIVEQR